MIKFLEDHWQMILIGVVGVVIGVILNILIRDNENRSLLDSLNKELGILEAKQKISGLTVKEIKEKEKLEAEIYILKFKCL